MEEAFGWTALCMFNYMVRVARQARACSRSPARPLQTPLSGFVGEPLNTTHVVKVTEAHDMHTLLFSFLDELLFLFSTEFFVVREMHLCKIDRSDWTIKVTWCVPAGGELLIRRLGGGYMRGSHHTHSLGSRFVPGKSEQGTEVKVSSQGALV